MSRGRPSTTGPGRPAAAVWKARETYSAMRAPCSIWAVHLVMEPNTAGRSISCQASRCSKRRSTWPQNRIIGVQSCWARYTPSDALVTPGPRVTKHTPGRPVARPTASAIIAAPPSWRQTVTVISGRSYSASSTGR